MKTTLTFTLDDVNEALLMFATREGWLGLAEGTPVATRLSYTLTRSDGKHSVSEVTLDVATDVIPEEVTLARARVSRGGAGMMTHILREAASPVERTVWTMWCGAQCLALDDGSIVPVDVDFYNEEHAAKASCVECLKAKLAANVGSRVTEKLEGGE